MNDTQQVLTMIFRLLDAYYLDGQKNSLIVDMMRFVNLNWESGSLSPSLHPQKKQRNGNFKKETTHLLNVLLRITIKNENHLMIFLLFFCNFVKIFMQIDLMQ